MRTVVLAAVVLAGCAAPAPPAPGPAGPFIVLKPPAARTLPRPVTARVPADSPAAVTRDSAALQDQATAYVTRKDSNPAVIDRLSTLTVRVRETAARARRTKRATDVAAARAAADALAAYIETQTKD